MGAIGRLKRVKDRLMTSFQFDFSGDDVVIILGSGRSGTSWLANICNYKNSFRYLFEPLNPEHLPETLQTVSWSPNPSVSVPAFDRIVRGDVRGAWVDSRNRRKFAKRRLIKEIRANLMIPWLTSNHPRARLVFLLRNPLAVAASRKSLFDSESGRWVWEPCLSTLLKEPEIRRRMSDEEVGELTHLIGSGPVMEAIADWCLNNIVASRMIGFNLVHIVFYEELVAGHEEAVDSLLQFIGVSSDSSINDAMKRKSETSRRGTVDQQINKESVINDWKCVLSAQEIEEATKLLDMFEVSKFYTSDWEPIRAEVRR